jgi:hypothetical protein
VRRIAVRFERPEDGRVVLVGKSGHQEQVYRRTRLRLLLATASKHLP